MRDLNHFFLTNAKNEIYYVDKKDKNNKNNPINRQVKAKIKEIKSAVAFCQKQLALFADSINQEFLAPSQQLKDLIPFLGRIVDANKKQLDYQALASDKNGKKIQYDALDYLNQRKFADWIQNHYNIVTYLPKENK